MTIQEKQHLTIAKYIPGTCFLGILKMYKQKALLSVQLSVRKFLLKLSEMFFGIVRHTSGNVIIIFGVKKFAAMEQQGEVQSSWVAFCTLLGQ